MTPSAPHDGSMPLVILKGQRDDMAVLVSGKAPNGNSASLPRLRPTGEAPLPSQASRYLKSLGLDLPPESLSSIHNRPPDSDRQFSSGQGMVGHCIGIDALPNRPYHWLPLAGISRFENPDGSAVCAALAQFWPCMPMGNTLFKNTVPYGGGRNRDHAIFFGGTFNPWHRAHQACIELCPLKENVVVVPDTNPRKPISHRDCPWQEYQQLIADVKGLGVTVFPGYASLDHPNPTASWLPKTRYAKRDLLIGDDSWVTLPTWIEAERLVAALNAIWIAPRRSAKKDIEFTERWLHRNAPKCEVHFLGDHPYRDISSTKIRRSQT